MELWISLLKWIMSQPPITFVAGEIKQKLLRKFSEVSFDSPFINKGHNQIIIFTLKEWGKLKKMKCTRKNNVLLLADSMSNSYWVRNGINFDPTRIYCWIQSTICNNVAYKYVDSVSISYTRRNNWEANNILPKQWPHISYSPSGYTARYWLCSHKHHKYNPYAK